MKGDALQNVKNEVKEEKEAAEEEATPNNWPRLERVRRIAEAKNLAKTIAQHRGNSHWMYAV